MEDNEQCLLDLVRTYKVKSIKNRQENSAMWDVLTETYNKATGENYTKVITELEKSKKDRYA